MEAWEFWTRLQALQRVIREDAGDADIPARLRPLFADLGGVEQFDDLAARMTELAHSTKAIYDRLLGPAADGA